MTEKPNDKCPDDRLYTARGLWIKRIDSDIPGPIKDGPRKKEPNGEAALYEAGLAPRAFETLGAPMYLETPGAGKAIRENAVLVLFESAKTVAEIPAPFALTVTEVHEALADEPERAARDPWNSWLVRFSADPGAIESARADGTLLDAETCARDITERP